MITVAYHAGVKEVQDDAALAALFAAPAYGSPFDRAAWFALLERYCRLPTRIALATDGTHSAGLALTGEDHLRSLANWYSFTARPLVSPGADGGRLLTALAQDLRRRSWRVTLAPLPDEDGSASMAENAFLSAGWRVSRTQCDVNHVLTVGGRSYAEYLAARPGALRTTLRRKAGKVSVELLTQFDQAAWAAYEAIYAASWKPGEGSPAFLRAFAEQEGKAGRLRMALAHVDDRPIAAQFWTVEGGTAFIHKLAHAEDARHLSPGSTLSAALFEQVIDRDRVREVDFGTGDDRYKRDWMEEIRPRFRLDCLNVRALRAWPHIARAALHHLAHRARAA